MNINMKFAIIFLVVALAYASAEPEPEPQSHHHGHKHHKWHGIIAGHGLQAEPHGFEQFEGELHHGLEIEPEAVHPHGLDAEIKQEEIEPHFNEEFEHEPFEAKSLEHDEPILGFNTEIKHKLLFPGGQGVTYEYRHFGKVEGLKNPIFEKLGPVGASFSNIGRKHAIV